MRAKLTTILALSAVLWMASPLPAAGLLSRLRARQSNATRTLERTSSSPDTARTRTTNRLPSGRNYYQGRYYGNLNNRFYGPQYGYF